LLYELGSLSALTVGFSAAEDLLRAHNSPKDIKKDKDLKSAPQNNLQFYHILCVIYVGLALSGISIVRRMFPFHIPGTEFIVHIGAGVIFFPLTFSIQDITTEVYGYSYSRQMVWLVISMILFYMLYTQIAIHLPIGSGDIYKNTAAFTTVYSTIPRQLLALIISMLAGNLVNDFFISKSKIIFAGQYLWARILGSTMIGEAITQIVGVIIGFSDTLDFYKLLPNMLFAYGYKQLWNVALIPLIYIITSYLKKKEGIDVYDYDINYTPFSFKLNKIK
jgi:queuosine precursor transporter